MPEDTQHFSLDASPAGPPVANLPPGLLRRLAALFGRPAGPLGHLAGWAMARHDQDDRWLVELLGVGPTERVLDIGCGPGVLVALAAAHAPEGFVAGLDHSAAMLRQAARRNRAAIAAGRVELRLGEAACLPWPAGSFTRASALHTVQFWPSMAAGLREAHRVLVLGGLLALGLRMRREEAGRLDPSRYGFTDVQVAELREALAAAGFGDIEARRRDFGRETITALLARR